MKILHVMAGRRQGGAETYATDMMLALHTAGLSQCCVVHETSPRFGELEKGGVRLAPKVLSPRIRFFQKRKLRKLLEEEKPDLVHCWMRRAASLMPFWRGGPVIGWFGGYYDPRHFSVCTHFVGVTEDIRRHTIGNGVAPERAFYIPTFPDVRDEPAANRAAFDTPEDAPVILALSRLHEKKGLDTLLRAAQNLAGVYVWLAGEGPLRVRLEKLAKELGIAERVRFLGWRTDRGALLRAANVCALPSRYEPFGTVILEAWAAKTPFVAARSAGPEATVTDGENGLLVPIDDATALADALSRALNDEPLQQKMVFNGYERYSRFYMREAVTKQMIGLYEELIRKGIAD